MDAQDRRKSRKKPKNPISLMNLHNNEAGRKVSGISRELGLRPRPPPSNEKIVTGGGGGRAVKEGAL